MPISWRELGVTVGVNGGVAVAVFFIFNYLRRLPFLADYYGAKRKLSLPFRFRPPRLPPTMFTWMVPVFTMKDEQFVACAGFDAFAYVSFLKLALRLTFWITLLMGVFVLPTNWAGGNFVEQQIKNQNELEAKGFNISLCDNEVDPENGPLVNITKPKFCDRLGLGFLVSGFDKTSMTNIDAESKFSKKSQEHLLWVHLVALWIVTLFVMKLLWTHWQESIKWRVLYLAQTRKNDAAHTVLVRDIPGTPHGTPVGRLYDNIDGTIGFLLPRSFKAKIKVAMEEGVSKVFGKVSGKVSSKLGGASDLFKDRNYNVYRRAGDRAHAYRASATYADADGAFFDAASNANDSFMSAEGGSVYGTPRSSLGRGHSSAGSLPTLPAKVLGDGDDFEPPYPDGGEDDGPRPPIAARRNLRKFRFQKARTDFETWRQAENALQNGVSVKELVRREFVGVFGSQAVRHVTVMKNELTLGGLKSKYEKVKEQVEDLTDSWISSLRRKKPIKRRQVTVKPNSKDAAMVKKWGSEKCKVDEMEYKMWLMEDSLLKLKEEQAHANEQETSCAFVTLTSRITQASAASGMLSYREELWVVDAAPEPTEVLWSNIAFRGWERSLRSLLALGIFTTLIIFMLPIITFISQLVNIEAYAVEPGAQGAWARWILRLPVVSKVLPGILPTLGLKIFLALIPILLRLTSLFVTRHHSESAVDFDVGRKFFIFQFIVVFLFLTVISAMSSGGDTTKQDEGKLPIVTLANQLIDNPSQIPTWLGTSIPQVAPTYLQYILVNGVLAKGIAFLRLPGAAIYYILSRLSGTKRQKKKLWSQQYMQYGPELADHTITMLLVFVFCLMQPFIPLVALMYFICNYFYARYDLLYSKRESFQSGGLFWPVIFDQIYLGIFVMLVGYFALFGIKRFPEGVVCTVPLVILLLMYRRLVHTTFKRPMEVLSLHAAADLDRADVNPSWQRSILPEEEQAMMDAEWDLEEVKFGPVEERYMQPSLIVDDYAHVKTLEEARDVSQRVDAFNADGDVDQGAFMLDDELSDVSDHTDVSFRRTKGGKTASGPMIMAGHVPLSKRQERSI